MSGNTAKCKWLRQRNTGVTPAPIKNLDPDVFLLAAFAQEDLELLHL
jgi:hypothetical protein